MAIHLKVPLAVGRTNVPQVAAFFENLLPEGEPRSLISVREQVTSVFGLIFALGRCERGSIRVFPLAETLNLDR